MRYIMTQFCGILLLLLPIISLAIQKGKVLRLRGARYYKYTLCTVFVCLLLDIISVITIMRVNEAHLSITTMVCRLHLVSVIAVGVSIFEYMLADQYKSTKILLYKTFIWMLSIAASFHIALSPIQIYYDGKQEALYTYGDAVSMAYICVATLAVISSATAKYLDGRMPNTKAKYVRLWALLITASGIAQVIMGNLQITGFVMSLGAVVMFETMESPNRYRDFETDLFNALAFKLYIHEQYALEKPVYCVRLAINTGHKEMTLDEVTSLMSLFADALRKCPGTVFRTNSYTFAILSDDEKTISRTVNRIEGFVKEADADMKLPGIRNSMYVLKNPYLFYGPENLINFYYKLKTYKPEHYEPLHIIEINENTIDQIGYDEMIRKEIKSAISEDRVEVYYQPIYDTRVGRFNSAEALVRIRGTDGRIFPPCEIIPIAEDSGLIVPLGEKIFSIVCNFLGSNQKPKNLKYIEVNLSAVQCRHENLYDAFTEIMIKNGVKPGQINLEITETARLNTSKKTLDLLKTFKRDGVTFSLDDFGTGNSNLDYMISMPMVSIVKFDHSITSGYFTNPRVRTAIPFVIKMAKEMNLEIVCEGVETREQLEAMKELGIEYIQGYHFSKPLPKDEFLAFMEMYKNGFTEVP